MALIVLYSTTSFAVNLHYCGKDLTNVSVLNSEKSCGMEMEKLPKSDDCSLQKTDCCADECFVVNGQKELKQSTDQLTFQQQVFTVRFFYTYLNLFEGLDRQVIPFKNYTPPLLVKNLLVLEETYLIWYFIGPIPSSQENTGYNRTIFPVISKNHGFSWN